MRAPRQGQSGLGGPSPWRPRLRVQLLADLELVIRRQREQGRTAVQTPVLAELDRPAASGSRAGSNGGLPGPDLRAVRTVETGYSQRRGIRNA
jgi:hypothetical protein